MRENPCETVVVDNASSDPSAEMVRTEFPQVKLLVNDTNRGYGAAANQGIDLCRARRYVLLLNSDVRLEPGALRALTRYLDEHPSAAVVGPRLVNPDGSLQRSCFPFPTLPSIFLWENTFGGLLRYVRLPRNRYLRTWPHDRPQVVPWVLGAAMAIRRDSFDAVGRFEESYFMYWEEVDLCYRLRDAGWEVHFAPVTTMVHHGGASTAQHRADMNVHLFAGEVRFFRRHYTRLRSAGLIIALKFIALTRLVGDGLRLQMNRRAVRRAEILEDMTVWRRVLRGQWRIG
jgi:hypothetical protein